MFASVSPGAKAEVHTNLGRPNLLLSRPRSPLLLGPALSCLKISLPASSQLLRQSADCGVVEKIHNLNLRGDHFLQFRMNGQEQKRIASKIKEVRFRVYLG